MIRLISRQMHGLLTDYPYVVVNLAAPYLFGFGDVPSAVLATRIFAAIILFGSLLTRAEWGLFRVVPYKVHLVLDATLGLVVVASPWLFGFADNTNAKLFAIAAGVFGIVAGTFSKTDEMPAGQIRAAEGSGRP
ncbi:hypothetical protein EON77_15155 [bacterium]|nr:MAG: hypothetical protein EON77_15155 [bacterium]